MAMGGMLMVAERPRAHLSCGGGFCGLRGENRPRKEQEWNSAPFLGLPTPLPDLSCFLASFLLDMAGSALLRCAFLQVIHPRISHRLGLSPFFVSILVRRAAGNSMRNAVLLAC